jgi:epoxyqueuosine reductase
LNRKKLLLNTCCAPCFSYVYELLKGSYNVTSFYYNPNIAPVSEYKKRLNELLNFAQNKKLKLIEGEYDSKNWTTAVKPFRFKGERSFRCRECYRYRLERSFIYAKDKRYDIVCTTLSVSPYKDSRILNNIGKELEQRYNIEYLESDFKKNDGYKKSIELSNVYGFYRQNYCGCIYSKMERDKGSIWYRAQKEKLMIER